MLDWLVISLFIIVFWLVPYLVWFKPKVIKKLIKN